MTGAPPLTVSNWGHPAAVAGLGDSLIVERRTTDRRASFQLVIRVPRGGGSADPGVAPSLRLPCSSAGPIACRPSRRQKLNSINRCIYIDIRKLVSSLCRCGLIGRSTTLNWLAVTADDNIISDQTPGSRHERHCFSPHETFIGRDLDTLTYVGGPIINQLVINAVGIMRRCEPTRVTDMQRAVSACRCFLLCFVLASSVGSAPLRTYISHTLNWRAFSRLTRLSNTGCSSRSFYPTILFQTT